MHITDTPPACACCLTVYTAILRVYMLTFNAYGVDCATLLVAYNALQVTKTVCISLYVCACPAAFIHCIINSMCCMSDAKASGSVRAHLLHLPV